MEAFLLFDVDGDPIDNDDLAECWLTHTFNNGSFTSHWTYG